MAKWVYMFTEGNADMRNLLGGKGANLAEMTNLGLPVPQGFTVTTEACTQYYEDGRQINDEIMGQIMEAIDKMEGITGKKFGDAKNPLLVSVRSGARASMPGMFLWNLLLGEKNELRNRTMHINGKFFVAEETNIGFGKADIGTEKAEIDKWRVDMLPDISDKTVGHIEILFEKYGTEEIFGRTGVESTTGLRSTRASELLKLLVERGLVENVKGQGKGKYRFRE